MTRATDAAIASLDGAELHVSDARLLAASEGDRERVYALRRRAYTDLAVRALGAWDDVDQRARFAARWRLAGTFLLVRDGAAVGALEIDPADDALWIRSLVVDPARQGEGLGSATLAVVSAAAGAHGLDILLSVDRQNPRAAALYERVGFHLEREEGARRWMRLRAP